jgi:hypothetical protein
MYLKVNQTIEETINLIKEKIRTNTPFALSRFGDGEIHMLNKTSSPQHQMRSCSNWGYEYPSGVGQLYDDATAILLNGLRHSDVIGLMDSNNDIARKINYKESVWSIQEEFLKTNNIDTDTLKISDHMLPRSEEFGKPENFREILQGRSLNIITTNTEKLKTKNLSKLLDAEVTFTHHSNTINFRNRNEFIDSFKDIKSDVVLVGCGLQKDYVVYLRHNYGKVAIDVGAMLDAWAGLKTRPWFQKGGKQEYLVL